MKTYKWNIRDFDKYERTFENVNFSMKNTQTSQQHTNKYEIFLETSSKNFKLHNNVKTHQGIQKMCPIRRWKAQAS